MVQQRLFRRQPSQNSKCKSNISNTQRGLCTSAQFNPEPVDMKPFDQAIFMIHKDRFEKIGTKDGDKIRFKIEMKVSEKRESGEEIL